jgi:erythromycin esterase-like protein
MTLRIRAAAPLTLLAAVAALALQDDPPPTDWIRRAAIPLTNTEAGRDRADLKPLRKFIGDARIVALGEATHGTREFFQLKHRLLEFLATEMGFTIFSIEANMPEAYRLNEYVLHGTGDPAELLRGLYFWTWNTEEVLDMIRWMREFNASGKGRVQFTGFDMQTPAVALEVVRDFVSRHDPDYASAVREASARATTARPASNGPTFGLASASLPGSLVAGKKIRFSGYIRSEDVTDGYAGLWCRVDGASGMLALDNMNERGAVGTTDWKRYEISMTVDAAAKGVVFGALMPGKGSAWFDDLTLEIDGVPYTGDGRFDFAFESDAVRGFFTGGRGYQIGLDSAVAHSGTKSLRMKGGPPPVEATASTPGDAAAAWAEVITHIEAGRAKYRAAGATEQAIDWATQNARVVQQAMTSMTDPMARDRSMAANVAWILDQNPKAKVVLWAHDGHVAAGGVGHETMGSDLRKRYGQQMVVFGFAFNQGSFRAVELGVGKIRDFTVPPAPAGTLDAALAAARLPLFALDLRAAPPWFRQERKTRQIGAGFSDANADAYLMALQPSAAFDAILFVDTTTASRKAPSPAPSPTPSPSPVSR